MSPGDLKIIPRVLHPNLSRQAQWSNIATPSSQPTSFVFVIVKPVPNLSRPRLRHDFLRRQRLLADDRSIDRVIAHYVLERELGDRIRHAAWEERPLLYTEVYKELFASLPDHPQCRRKDQGSSRAPAELRRIEDRVNPNTVFLEIGCGDAALGFAAAKRVRAVYGVDVTDALINFAEAPRNFQFLRTSGVEIPLGNEEVDFAYSNQLLEHLHPEDAAAQLREIHRVLKPHGFYMCITPSRITGPHDVSCYFDYEATGLHLREYDYGALRTLFRGAGFGRFLCSAWIRGREMRVPYLAFRGVERSLLSLPKRIRAFLTLPSAVQTLLGLNVLAEK
jgi:SAM-dependent methyltransferase